MLTDMKPSGRDPNEMTLQVDTTDGTGIGKKVARLRPLIVVKG
jgi:hypothetical protein